MKQLAIGSLFVATLLSSLLYAQDEVPLGDVARQSRTRSEALRKSNPNLRPPISMDGPSTFTENSWDGSAPDPTGAKEIVDRGLALYRQGRFDEALVEYTKALELRPDYARAYYDIGVVKGEQGKRSEAIAAYKQALSLDATHYAVYLNLSTALYYSGNFDEAEEVAGKGLGLFPDDVDLLQNLGNSLVSQHKYEEAIPYFRQQLDIDPSRSNARQSLCYTLLKLGRRDEVLKVRAEWPGYRPNEALDPNAPPDQQ
jgi:tetratricopeptide (TPR) repeat protein